MVLAVSLGPLVSDLADEGGGEQSRLDLTSSETDLPGGGGGEGGFTSASGPESQSLSLMGGSPLLLGSMRGLDRDPGVCLLEHWAQSLLLDILEL